MRINLQKTDLIGKIQIILFINIILGGFHPEYGPGSQWNTTTSTIHSFIIFESITLNGSIINSGFDNGFSMGGCETENCDIIAGIYNGNVVGWSFMPYLNNVITLPIQLNDGITSGTEGYPEDIPNVYNPLITFNFYDASEKTIYYNIAQSEIQAGYYVMQGNLNITESGEYCSSNGFELGLEEEYCMPGIGCNSSDSEFFDAVGDSYLDCDGLSVEDCNGDIGGNAFIDNCGICSGGYTNITPNENGCFGCMYHEAINYNEYVHYDDGSCEFGSISTSVIYDLIEGNNLVSFSGIDGCETIAALGDLEFASENFNFIIGQGQGLFYDEDNQEWVGNLTNLSTKSGYWLNTNNDMEFLWSLNCEESTSLDMESILPSLFDYKQSTEQAFYLINNITIKNKNAMEGDILLAYNKDILVGASYYNRGLTILPVMGKDLSKQTNGFLKPGDIPSLRLYKIETGEIISLESNLEPFSNLLVSKVETINTNTDIIPSYYALNPVYPNPFNPTTNISYLLPENRQIKITIHDVKGKKIETLLQSKVPAGSYTLSWNAENLASGIYFVKLTASDFTQTQKLMLIK
ncbi:MAG: hypothetical protein CMF96_06415 [Candidatus Marinimicrobia bacterium]|nr:hypothetical protein [Candidatus Neomarinimicrobiota bacterium]